MIDNLENNELLPTELLADTSYGGDENYCRCERKGIELVAPVPGKVSEEKLSGEKFSEPRFPVEYREVIDVYGIPHIEPYITIC